MDSFEESLNDLLVNTFNNILKYEEQSLKKISATAAVTVREAHMIEAIAKCGDRPSASDIASMLGIALPTATVAIKRLEKKGLITKVPCTDDGRRSIITLTETGVRINRAHSFFHRRMVRNVSRYFEDGERQLLLSAIDKLNNFFKEKVEA